MKVNRKMKDKERMVGRREGGHVYMYIYSQGARPPRVLPNLGFLPHMILLKYNFIDKVLGSYNLMHKVIQGFLARNRYNFIYISLFYGIAMVI